MFFDWLFHDYERAAIASRRRIDRTMRIFDEIGELERQRDELLKPYVDDIMETGTGKYLIPTEVLEKICAFQYKIELKQSEFRPNKVAGCGIKSLGYYTPKGLVELIGHD